MANKDICEFPYEFKYITPEEQEQIDKKHKNYIGLNNFLADAHGRKWACDLRSHTDKRLCSEIYLSKLVNRIQIHQPTSKFIANKYTDSQTNLKTVFFGPRTNGYYIIPWILFMKMADHQFRCRLFRVGPQGFIVYEPYKKEAAKIYNMPLRPTDIFVASYQRSGTTWTQELVWLLANNLDYTTAAEVPLTHRYPFLENPRIEPLSLRRDFASLCVFYRLYNGLCSEELFEMVPTTSFYHRTSRHRQRAHSHTLEPIPSRTVRFHRNFIPRTIKLWNELPAEVFPLDYSMGFFKKEVVLLMQNISLFQFIDLSQIDAILEVFGADSDAHNLRNIITMMGQPVTGLLESMSSPRFIKTHLPMCLLNPKLLYTAKMVYVARDPRDVAVSSYHHAKLFKMIQFPGGFKEFWNLFYKGLFTFCPIIEHVKEAWDLRHHPNMLFLFYEELSKDLPASIRRVAKFLDKELNQEQMDRLCDHLSIENFKKNKSVNFEEMREYGMLAVDESFVRKGKTGGWRDYFDDEMTEQAEQWIKNNLRDTDLRYPHMDY